MGALGDGCKARGMTGLNEMSAVASPIASIVASATADDAATIAAVADADGGWVLSKSTTISSKLEVSK